QRDDRHPEGYRGGVVDPRAVLGVLEQVGEVTERRGLGEPKWGRRPIDQVEIRLEGRHGHPDDGEDGDEEKRHKPGVDKDVPANRVSLGAPRAGRDDPLARQDLQAAHSVSRRRKVRSRKYTIGSRIGNSSSAIAAPRPSAPAWMPTSNARVGRISVELI